MRSSRFLLPATAAVALLAACSDDDTVTDPTVDPTAFRADTVDTRVAGSTTGATQWVYLSLANPAAPVLLTDAQAATSAAWDIAVRGLSVKANGGEAGAGGVSVYCLCQNSAAAPAAGSADFFRALSSDGEAPEFLAVASAQAPAATQFTADSVVGINDWYAGTATRTLAPYVYAVHRAGSPGYYAKLQFTAVQNGSGATPGNVTFRYATASTAAGSAFGAAQTATVNVPATGRAYFSFATGPVADASGAWDVAFEGWRVRTNSGTSAGGTSASWGAVNLTTNGLAPSGFDAVAVATSIPPTPSAYRVDGLGTFALRPTWYYDSANRTAIPTFDVYLVRRGSAVYKVQFTGYRRQTAADPAPVSGYVAMRSAKIAG